VWPLRILALALPAAVGLDYVVRIGEAFRSYRAAVVARQVLDPCLRLVLSVGALALGAGLTALMGAYAVSSLVGLFVAVWLVARIERLRALDRGAVPSQAGRLLRFSLPLVFGGVLFDFAERIDILMIGLFRDEAQVGVYAVGSALARALLLLVASTMPVVGTLAAEAVGRGSAEDIARIHRTVTRWMLFFTAPLAAGLLLFPEEAVTLLFGREYAAAAGTLRVLVIAYLSGVLAGPVGLLLNTMGKTHWTLANMAVRTAVNVALNLVLIPRFGILGAAWGTVASLVIASGLMVAWLGKLAPIGRSYAGWGRPLLVLGAASGLGWGASRLLLAAAPAGAAAPWAAAVGGGLVLLAAFAAGVKVVPGCLEDEDLALLRLVRARR
jgi:O-antigen/teichoic acid export membrane protein